MAETKSSNASRRKRKKKKGMNAAVTHNESPTSSSSVASPASADESGSRDHPLVPTESNFEEELVWCVRQLELGLMRDKVTPAQRKESEQLIKKLQSTKTPLPRKRQMMRAVFGDYRTAMKSCPLKALPPRAEIKLESVKGQKLEENGKFFRHSVGRHSAQTVDTEFKFNFTIEQVQ